MPRVVSILLASLSTWFRSRLAMPLECIALRHQVVVYKPRVSRPALRPTDRLLWVWLSRLWPGWQPALEFVFTVPHERMAAEVQQLQMFRQIGTHRGTR